MKYTDLKHKSAKELQRILAEKRHELRELRFKAAENQLSQVHMIEHAKKDIAQILTALNVIRISSDNQV